MLLPSGNLKGERCEWRVGDEVQYSTRLTSDLMSVLQHLEDYLSSIQIDDDDHAFLWGRQEVNFAAFVATTKGFNAAQTPP